MAHALTQEQIDHLLEEMIEHQRRKVLAIARELLPGVTPEDLRNPHDFHILAINQRFNYEDGILAGYLGMRMAIQAEQRKEES
jgi:hypothetical protein